VLLREAPSIEQLQEGVEEGVGRREMWSFSRANPVGPQPTVHSQREARNAILYVTKTGVQWRYLPHYFPDWQSVYSSRQGAQAGRTRRAGPWVRSSGQALESGAHVDLTISRPYQERAALSACAFKELRLDRSLL
jgi:transposase